jgi:AraC-like DNA-binding protein
MARPRATSQLNEDQVEELAAIGCSDAEIAAVAGVSESTLQRRFDTHIKKGRAALRAGLRRKQLERANAGSDTMLIWLGKVYLDQRESATLTHAGEITMKGYVHISPDDWIDPPPSGDGA